MNALPPSSGAAAAASELSGRNGRLTRWRSTTSSVCSEPVLPWPVSDWTVMPARPASSGTLMIVEGVRASGPHCRRHTRCRSEGSASALFDSIHVLTSSRERTSWQQRLAKQRSVAEPGASAEFAGSGARGLAAAFFDAR